MRRLAPGARIDGLASDPRGLTVQEVSERRSLYGSNAIIESPRAGWADLVRDTVRDPMIWFLAGTALLFTWLGDYTEAIILVIALLPIAGMDAYLHRRTQASTEGLAGRLATTALVIRDGAASMIPAVDLVPGDLIVVPEGQPLPADGLVVVGDGLQIDESALTGEAMPVRKSPFTSQAIGAGDVAVDGIHWGFAGTRLLTNEARVRVVFTGGETLYGEIVRSAQAGRHERTPLQQAIGSLVTVLIIFASIVCIGLAATRFYQGHGIIDAIVSAVTLAVAAFPEEFPVVFAFFLGVGVYRLARRQALVRRAVVVENIGRVTCICTDKTGTLTEGRLSLAHIEPAIGIVEERLLRAAATASRPGSGDPLDTAILEKGARTEGPQLATFPFTEDRRREVAVIRVSSGVVLCEAKGEPETILQMSRLTPSQRAIWQAKLKAFATSGHKVIACCERTLQIDTWTGAEPDGDYDFLGLMVFADPVREGVVAAVMNAKAAGIRVIMVTGDHPETARAIAKEIGIGPAEPRIIEGDDLGRLLDRDGTEALRDIDVIARAVPAQKLNLVKALQRSGEIVAVTGDGVNDVPALQGADVGIAMGERGTRAAREVAAIVLLDDNFRTIVRAIAEGRQLFINLKLSFAYLLMVHIPLVVTAALIPLAGFPLLYLPVHIVWLELIIHPTALLVFQQFPPPGGLERVDRRPKGQFFNWREWTVIGLVGVVITLVVAVGYERSLGIGRDVEHARTMSIVALIVASATVTAGLSRLSTKAAALIVSAGVLSALVFVQTPAIAPLLHLTPLHVDDWLIASVGGLAAGALSALMPHMKDRQFQNSGQ